MPPLLPLADVQASEQAKKQFQAIQSAFGMVPNIFRALGHVPAVLQATLDMNAAIQQDLHPQLRELAYLKASQVNGCRYCLHYHNGAGKMHGLTEAQIMDLATFEESGVYSDLEKAVLRFAEQWTKQGQVDGGTIRHLEDSLTATQIVTLAATVGLAIWTNRFNLTFGIELP